MAREVVWTEPAWEDLEAASERGQIVPELRDPTTRELLVRPYRLVYRLSSSQVPIIAVIHGARRMGRR